MNIVGSEHSKEENIEYSDAQKARNFLRELSELSLKHGIGITGSAVLFVMEDEDKRLSYTMDKDSNLSLA